MEIRKSITLLVVVGTIVVLLTGCASSIQMNVETDSESADRPVGTSRLQELGNGLYYDQTTGIVYWWSGALDYGNIATTPTPYYSENGKMYRYNPADNTMEEIK